MTNDKWTMKNEYTSKSLPGCFPFQNLPLQFIKLCESFHWAELIDIRLHQRLDHKRRIACIGFRRSTFHLLCLLPFLHPVMLIEQLVGALNDGPGQSGQLRDIDPEALLGPARF